MKGIAFSQSKHGPDARCMNACGWREWYGEFSFLSKDEVRRHAQQHVRETGHSVEIELIWQTVYEPE